jgi:hypothetical protein
MNKKLEFTCILALVLSLPFFLLPIASAQNINEVFQTVAYLHGKGDVESAAIDGIEYEVWVKGAGDTNPHPYRKGHSGTGFFIRKGTKIYLITAAHVARTLKYETKVTIHGSGDKPLNYDLKDVTGSGNDRSWFFHNEADVALLPLNPSEQFKGIIKVIEHSQLLISENQYAQFRNRVLTTIGFPLSLGLRGKFSPITKSSKAASNLLNYKSADTKTETTFLILDDPSVQGFSGAPVYALSEVNLGGIAFGTGAFACVGLVHGTLSDNTGGKFAAIVPAYFISQTIDIYENRK